MRILILNQKDIARLFPLSEAIRVMHNTFLQLAEGTSVIFPRQKMWLPDKSGALSIMPGHLAPLGRMGLKVISIFPANRDRGLDSHQGGILLFDHHDGRILALLDASAVTAIRTAAVSALATQFLARSNAARLAILGTGVQAATHLEAMRVVRPISEVRIWGPHPEHVRQFVDAMVKRHALPVTQARSPSEAVTASDLVCTTTAARDPILQGSDLEPGMHINAVGSSLPFTRELSAAAVARSRLFVDRKEAALAEAGDIVKAVAEHAVNEDHLVGELTDLVTGSKPGRTQDADITLFKAVGLAAEDVGSAEYIYQKALQEGIGTSVDFGGEHFSIDLLARS